MKKMIPVLLVVVLGCFPLLFSCSSDKEASIPEDKMIDVLYDFHMAQALGNSGAFGTSRHERALYENAVYAKHGITEAEFDSALVWYTRHTKMLADIYKEVSKRMKKESRSVEKLISIRDKKPMTSERGDTVDVWAWNRALRLSRAALDNLYSFNLSSDSNYHATDSLVWSVHYRMLPVGGVDSVANNALVMNLMLHYAKDTTVNRYARVTESGQVRLSIQNDTLGEIKKISGMMYFMPDSCPCVVVADSITLYRYHVKRDTVQRKDPLPADEVAAEAVEPAPVEATKAEKVEQPKAVEPAKAVSEATEKRAVKSRRKKD